MRLVRFTTGDDPKYGIIQSENNQEYIAVLNGDPLFQKTVPTGQRIAIGDGVRLLTPVIPRSKVVGVGSNYAEHIAEMGHKDTGSPKIFLIPNTAVSGPDDPILLPDFSDEVSYEVELAVVIGKLAKDVTEEKALQHVLGYTIANDITARDAQRKDGQWARAKGFDSALPLGPWIETDLNIEDLDLQTRVNGEVVQKGNTKDMLAGVPFLISYISQAFTLLPGDVIITGTPAGVGLIKHADEVECEIEGIGVLRNPVLRRSL